MKISHDVRLLVRQTSQRWYEGVALSCLSKRVKIANLQAETQP